MVEGGCRVGAMVVGNVQFAHQFLLGRYILRGKNYYCFVFSQAKKIFGMKNSMAYSKDFFSSSYDL